MIMSLKDSVFLLTLTFPKKLNRKGSQIKLLTEKYLTELTGMRQRGKRRFEFIYNWRYEEIIEPFSEPYKDLHIQILLIHQEIYNCADLERRWHNIVQEFTTTEEYKDIDYNKPPLFDMQKIDNIEETIIRITEELMNETAIKNVLEFQSNLPSILGSSQAFKKTKQLYLVLAAPFYSKEGYQKN
jgi:hypothetical protein